MLLRLAGRAAARATTSGARPATPTQGGSPLMCLRGMAKDSRFNKSSPTRSPDSRSIKPTQTPPRQTSSPTSQNSPVTSAPESGLAGSKSQQSAGRTEAQSPPPVMESRAHDNTTSHGRASQAQESEQIPDLSKLPDLTQGIPSTLEYETTGTTPRSSLAAVGEGAAAGSGARGKGQLPASAYVSSTERRRQAFANYMFAVLGLSVVGGTIYLGGNWDEEEQRRHPDVPNGWGFGLWWDRVKSRLGETMNYYQEPAFEKLLPDVDPSFERPYTLCISMEDMLVHSEWTREHGWRVAKRPGVDYFLRYLSQYYELVLFTTVPFGIGEPLMRKLDPFRFIMWPLYREATRYEDGEMVKDLSYLNRDLSKVIILDTTAKHVRAQPENAIVLPKWTGDTKDIELVGLIPFLEYIHTMQYGDVRRVLKSFEGKDIPKEFARRESIARTEFNKQLEGQRGKSQAVGKGKGGGMGMLSSMLGLQPGHMSLMVNPEGEENPTEAFAKGKMLQDIARERGQRNYQVLDKEIRENGEKWLKEEVELQEKAQKEAMQSWKGSFMGWFGVQPDDKEQPDTTSSSDTKA